MLWILVIWLLGMWMIPEGAVRDVWCFGPLLAVGLLLAGVEFSWSRVERFVFGRSVSGGFFVDKEAA